MFSSFSPSTTLLHELRQQSLDFVIKDPLVGKINKIDKQSLHSLLGNSDNFENSLKILEDVDKLKKIIQLYKNREILNQLRIEVSEFIPLMDRNELERILNYPKNWQDLPAYRFDSFNSILGAPNEKTILEQLKDSYRDTQKQRRSNDNKKLKF